MGQGLMVKLDFESQPKCDPDERYRPRSCGSGSGSGMSRVFASSNSKGLCDVGSIDSPTSPLDLMMFPRLCEAIRSPRNRPPRRNSWDSVKPGLRSIVDDLDDDESNLFGGITGSYCGKNIVFGPKLRIKDSDACSAPDGRDGSSLCWTNSSIVFEIGETQSGADRVRNFLSCSADSCFGNRHPLSRKGPGSFGRLHGSDIELSEDYTCVISHGPGATTRTTHIFDDRVLECQLKDGAGMIISAQAEETIPPNGFLRTCYGCRKPLEDSHDIYIYRGDKAFCREECRKREILREGDPEEILKGSGRYLLDGME